MCTYLVHYPVRIFGVDFQYIPSLHHIDWDHLPDVLSTITNDNNQLEFIVD